MEEGEMMNLTTYGKNKKKKVKVFICKKKGHMKKDYINLEKPFYVPTFSKNLISISRLTPLDISFNFSYTSFTLSNKTKIIGFSALIENLYKIKLQKATFTSMHFTIGLKRYIVNEESSITLDFTDFETCVDCIKGTQTNKSKRGAKSTILLEIIHTHICCPNVDISSPKYFITFINDYSRCMYLYVLHSKDEALDAFKAFKAKVEK
ncbi:hypothetical protein CR513_35373, partial [Mucuna pruriens]